MKQDKVLIWLLAGACLVVFTALVFFDGYGLVAGVMGMACGTQCYLWARKIKQDGKLPFFIGLFFNVFGLLGYYIYSHLKE
jgi:hypothetical protein